MNSELKIAFVTSKDPNDRKSFSGIYFQMLRSLEAEFKCVTPIGPIKNKYLVLGLKVFDFIGRKLFSKGYNKTHNILLSKYYAKIIKSRLNKIDYDLIFAPAASTEIAFLKTSKPIFYFSDSSFNQLKDYYGVYTGLSKFSTDESNLIEQKALFNSKAVIHSSKWASDYVMAYYKVDKNKAYVVPFGANIDDVPDINAIEEKLNLIEKLNLLFIGVDWERKGGGIAYDAFIELNKMGLNTELTICGCIPPSVFQHSKLKIIPFLDKNNPEQYNSFLRLLKKSHFFIMPSRAECTAIALCEASAFGIPAITTNTGGTPSIIENGINGYMLDLTAGGLDFAKLIKRVFEDEISYKELVYTSREKYENELNWKSWGASIKDILISLPDVAEKADQ